MIHNGSSFVLSYENNHTNQTLNLFVKFPSCFSHQFQSKSVGGYLKKNELDFMAFTFSYQLARSKELN